MPTERSAAGYLVVADEPFVIDMGRGTFRNLSKVQDRNRIGHMLFTHMHVDHYSDFLPFMQNAIHESKERGRKNLHIIGPPGAKDIFGKMLGFPGLNEGKFKTAIREVTNESFRIGDARITPKEVRHVDKTYCVGYRIEHKGKTLVYSGDSRMCGEVMELCRDADVAILDCSIPKDSTEPMSQNHLGVTGCGLVAKKAHVKKLVLSHIYPACDRHDLVKECKEVFDGNIIVAKDMMKINV